MNSKTILFIIKSDHKLASFAKQLFQKEADNLDVAWTAISRVLKAPDSSTLVSADDLKMLEIESFEQLDSSDVLNANDLNSVDMVVKLNTDEKLPGPVNGDTQTWNVSGGDSLKGNISSLMVRLIMQGGRRTPVEEPVSQAGGTPSSKASSSVRVQLEKKKRRGKKVTTISGLVIDDNELQKIAKKLKQVCGTGGTVKDGIIEIQGNKCDQILEELKKLGYKAKRSGG